MGVDQAGAGPVARDRVVQRVTDLPCSDGVVCGNSIHIEEAENLTNVLIRLNRVQHAIAASGVRNLTIAHNIVVSPLHAQKQMTGQSALPARSCTQGGSIVANGDIGLTIYNNTIAADVGNCPIGGCCPGMVAVGFGDHVLVSENNVTASAGCEPLGVSIWGGVEGYPKTRDMLVSANTFTGSFTPLVHGKPFPGGVVIDGADGVVVGSSNVWSDGAPAGKHVCDCCQYGVMSMCQNITIGQ